MDLRINLLPNREGRAARRKRRRILTLAASILLTGTALGAANVAQCRHRSGLENDLAAMRTTTAALRRDAEAAGALEERIQEQRRGNAAVIGWLEGRTRPAKGLRGLSAAAPATLWLTRYAESDGITVLEGQATDDASITRFLRNLPGEFAERQLVEAGEAAGDQDFRRFVVRTRTAPLSEPASPGE